MYLALLKKKENDEKVKKCMIKVMNRTIYTAFSTWKFEHKRSRSAKKLLRRVMNGSKRDRFLTWIEFKNKMVFEKQTNAAIKIQRTYAMYISSVIVMVLRLKHKGNLPIDIDIYIQTFIHNPITF